MISELRRSAAFALTGERYVREVDVAPEALRERLRAVINRRPKRAFGVLKVSAEWVGVVAGNEFVVWERQQHATRAAGRIRGRRGGSLVEAHIGLTRRTWALGAVFFALFALAAFGILARQGGMGLEPVGLAIAAAGILATLALFWWGALRQRAALRAFLDEVFRERP